jgi:DNA-binding beta-propeller fold protein YncE
VTVFDLKTLATSATIPIAGHNPDAIVFDAPSARVFTFNGRSHDATAIDAKSGKPVATIALSGKPEFAVSDGKGRIFVNIEDRAELSEIDTKAAKLVATWPLPGCEEPSGLALDVAHARLFSVCQNGHMVVTDARSGRHVATVAIGSGPDAVAFDSDRQLVFSSNGEDGTLSVIHEDSADRYTVLGNLSTQRSARTLALDARSHRLFLAAAEFEPLPANHQPHQRATMKPDSFTVLVAAPTATP